MASEIKKFPERFDVIMAGGGVAGTVAALAAARTGAKTLVIEKLNCLGGNFTAGIMGTTWTFNDQDKVIVGAPPSNSSSVSNGLGRWSARTSPKMHSRSTIRNSPSSS